MSGHQTEKGTVLVGVTGGIGAYKACELVRDLMRRGYRVKVAMTEAGTRFVAPLTFRTLTGEPVAVSLWEDEEGPVHHVSLAQEADVMVIAPCTANVIAKLAHGRADDLLTTTALATDAPMVLAPAMNERMWEDAATRENVAVLRARGTVLVGPDTGDLACGGQGVGRMAPPGDVADAVDREAARRRDLEGVRVLVTAGGTREPVDPVRFLGNRSSGLTGFLIAEEAARRAASVTLVAAPGCLPDPFGVEVVRVETAEEMRDEVLRRAPESQVVVMAAAVADYRPAEKASRKIRKDEEVLRLELVRTPDILSEVGGLPGERLVVGFAAETEDVADNALKKLEEKRADLMVANDVSVPGLGFASERNAVVFVTRDSAEATGELDKSEIARRLLERVSGMLRREGEGR